MKLRSKILFSLIAMLLLAGIASPQKIQKNKYQNIEVARFDIKEGVKFPPDYLITMTEELVKQLQDGKKFKQVLRAGETPAEPSETSIKLVGTVTEFKAGSRAKRYLIGFGAGKTKIVAHVKFIESATGQVLYEKDVDGKVWIGFVGGDSIGATRGLAKEVASVAKKQFF